MTLLTREQIEELHRAVDEYILFLGVDYSTILEYRDGVLVVTMDDYRYMWE